MNASDRRLTKISAKVKAFAYPGVQEWINDTRWMLKKIKELESKVYNYETNYEPSWWELAWPTKKK